MTAAATVEVRLPLGVLAPTARCSRSKDGQRVGDEVDCACGHVCSQRMAVCGETGLLAIANGRVVDLYDADAIHVPASDDSNGNTHVQHSSPCDAHLPFAGQIVLSDHLEGYIDDQQEDKEPMYATCVAFVAPGFLLVAAASCFSSSSSPSVWLCGFRMYARSVAIAVQRYAPSSLLVHCSFADQIPSAGAIATLQAVHQGVFSTREAGAVVVLFDDQSTSFGVFQWAERFSDRVLSIARLPSLAALSALAVSSDAQWVALTDRSGAVYVVDFTRFAWELSSSSDARSLVLAASGKRLALGASCRMGRISQREHPLAPVRLVCQARTGAVGSMGTSLRWWRPELGAAVKRPGLYLLLGQSDGALAVMILKKEKDNYGDHSCALKTVEIYPAIRALKNDPLVLISEPEYSESGSHFRFSTVSRMSWRQWAVGFTVNGETGRPRLQWPTLTDSLGLRTHQFDGHDAFGALLLSSSSSVAQRLERATSHEHQSTTSWLFVLMREEIRATACFDRRKKSKVPQGVDTSTTMASIDSATHGIPEEPPTGPSPAPAVTLDVQVEATTVENGSSDGQHSVLTTLQDRYKLPAMRASRHSERAAAVASETLNTSVSSPAHQRLTKEQYNSRLAAMAQRVDRLSTNLHTLRTSFQLFTDDVQRHMTFISNQLEQLDDTAETATRDQNRQ